jgi:hypothetical protein
MRARLLALGLALAGCEAAPVEPPGPDPVDAAPPSGCTALQAAWAFEMNQVSRYCTDDEDCLVVGGAGGCGCRPSLGPCRGLAVSGAAYTDAEAAATGSRWVRECSDPVLCDSLLDCRCDCAPSTTICINNRCQLVPGAACP